MGNFIETSLPGVYYRKLKPFIDHRGTYLNLWTKHGVDLFTGTWMEDDISISEKNVLRGLHGDNRTWKLICCPFGEIYVVVVDNNKDSKHYKKWLSFDIGESNPIQLLIKPKFGLGHLVLSDKTAFFYKQSQLYLGMENQFTLRWNDPSLSIVWPIDSPILSDRDKNAPLITD